MLEPQERTLLNGFYKNASVGADATVNILDKVTHPDLREELCTQLEYYRKQKQEICRQMQQGQERQERDLPLWQMRSGNCRRIQRMPVVRSVE